MRVHPTDAPFALYARADNADRLYCLNQTAEGAGLSRGMGLGDARARCPDLRTQPHDGAAEARFRRQLARWAGRWCPWVAEEADGLTLDITGSAHLFDGEAAMLETICTRLRRMALTVAAGLADTPGAAWALARSGGAIAPVGETATCLAPLPAEALRLPPGMTDQLRRLGLSTIGELQGYPRAPLARRFGPDLMLRIDQAMGTVAEPVVPLPDPPRFAARLTLPEPIGLTTHVMAGLQRLLAQVCAKLEACGKGARHLVLTARRVDRGAAQVEVRLAQPMREATRIARLFEKGIDAMEAGFGIDQLRLEAITVEPLAPRQISGRAAGEDALANLITRLGTRIGLENITRALPADSHIPEKSFIIAPVAWSEAATGGWCLTAPRPLLFFAPEPIEAHGARPPARFRWRRMWFSTGRATGPERIAPEWWLDDPAWHRGVRDYWRIETRQGRRLWLFHTPQNPRWFVQGEFA